MAGFNPSQARVPPGQPGGGEWGAPRNAAAAKAQASKTADAAYKALLAMPAGHRATYLAGLKKGALEALSRVAYSFPTRNPKVVAARFAISAAMAKRGLDVRKYGALGR